MSGSITAAPLFTVNHATNGGASGNSESIAFDAARNLLFVMGGNGVDALDAATGALVFSISRAQLATAAGIEVGRIGSGNSVAVSGDTLAFTFDGAVPGLDAITPTPPPQGGTPGFAAAYTLSGTGVGTTAAFKGATVVGVTPDMITFTPDGTRALVAIEAEPRQGYTVPAGFPGGTGTLADAPGGLAVIDVATWTSTFVGLGAFDAQAVALRAAGVKLATSIPAPGLAPALPSLDLEPEYIAVSPDGTRAFVTIQENNAIGVFDLTTNSWTAVLPLGLANHSGVGNGIDTSDRDGGPIIRQVPIFGQYQPDGIALFQQGGRTYLVTANEGDAREYGGVFNEGVRISDLVPATGSTAPAGMPTLDPALLAVVQPRRGDADLGRLEVSRWSGDTDLDGDLDQLHAFGGRSFTVWEVGGTASAPTLTRTFDSGQLIDQIIASQFPARYDDSRSDNKGAEPENITLGTIDGVVHAFVGLERANANMVFRIDNPTSPTYVGLAARAGDTAPETSAFLPATGGQPARLAVANEVSATTTVFSVAPTAPANFTLQILHGSDFEAGLLASGRAKQFAAIVDRLEDALPNSITVSGGDNFIPGPFAAAGTDPALIPVLRAFYARELGVNAADLTGLFGTTPAFFSADIALLNAIGIQASALGNHDFDLGTNPLNAVVDFAAGTSGTTLGRITNIGAQFPYLSANLDFSADTNIRAIVTQTLREASTYRTTNADVTSNQAVANEAADAQIAPWTTIVEGGQTIGILAVTTQILAQISSPGLTRVLDPAGDGGRDNMAELATILQPLVDQMQGQGINKIVLLSHLQQYANELALAPLLRGVDVIVSAGSHTLFDSPGGFPLRPGETPVEGYPVFRTGADGNPVAIVSTTGEYAHVGRLVVTFDANGVLIPDTDGAGGLGIGGVDPSVSGAIATTDANVAAVWGADAANAYAPGTRGFDAQAITNAVTAVLNAKDGNLFGRTDVFLEGRRNEVRSEETNLGNLTADANLFVARQADAGVTVSIKNGGGIRAEIGAIVGQPIPEELPPLANPDAGKPAGAVSQLDIENSLRFNNTLTIVSVTAANLERIVEHAVAAWTPTATPGQFGQFGGLAFSFDPTRVSQVITQTGPASAPDGASVTREGERVRNLVVTDDNGNAVDTLVRDGVFQGDPNRVIELVTLNFLAGNGTPAQRFLGGDSYPFPLFTIPGTRVDLLNSPLLADGAATFAAKGSEQDALAEFLLARHGTPATAFDDADTTPAGDLRIQNLNFRADTVGNPFIQVEGPGGEMSSVQTTRLPAGGEQSFALAGTSAAETFFVPAGNIQLDAGGGNDIVFGGSGNDLLRGNDGDDELQGGAGNDVLGGGAGMDIVEGGEGSDQIFGEAGADELSGGGGDDVIYGGAGGDVMMGGQGNDTYQVDNLGDTVEETAAEGSDSVFVTINGWTASAGTEFNYLVGTATLIFGSEGADVLVANAGNMGSRLFGNAGGDQLWGAEGNDELWGGAGRDVIRGAGGADVINGGAGNDQLVGGMGADRFVFDAAGWGRDEVFDFSRAEGDQIDLRGSGYTLADLAISVIGTTTRVEVNGDRMDFYNVPGGLAASDFLFA